MFPEKELGMRGLVPEPCAPCLPAAVSQMRRAIQEERQDPSRPGHPSRAEMDSAGFHISVAADRASREEAYRLAQGLYRLKGYARQETPWSVGRYDADPRTIVLLARDRHGRAAGTASLVFDSPARLPCDELYEVELAPLRARGRRLVEVTRLAIAEGQARAKGLLVGLCDYLSIYARRARGSDDFVIEVHPRHAAFYQRLMAFRPLGPQRPCPRVNGAPAVLLCLDLHEQERLISQFGGRGPRVPGERSLYTHFMALGDEAEVALSLVRQHRPISPEEIDYFGLAREGQC